MLSFYCFLLVLCCFSTVFALKLNDFAGKYTPANITPASPYGINNGAIFDFGLLYYDCD